MTDPPKRARPAKSAMNVKTAKALG